MKLTKDPGSARDGFDDWYWQRLSAVVLALLLPLPFFLLLAVYSGSVDQMGLLDILDTFVSRLLHTLLILAMILHAYMGLKVIVEDYVPQIGRRVVLIAGMLVAMTGMGIWWLALIWAWAG